MANSDAILRAVLSKTQSGKLVWEDNTAQVGDSELTISTDDDDRHYLYISKGRASHCFQEPIVDEIYEEVERQQFFNGGAGSLAHDLDDL